MRVLVACEESQVVTKAFRALGHEAYSCDLKPCSGGHPEWHMQCDCREAIQRGFWDLIIFHPDCTEMALSGNRWYAKGKQGYYKRLAAIKWTVETWELIKKCSLCACLENPASVIFSQPGLRNPQYIQPFQFGHGETKKTGLKLCRLPELYPTNEVEGRVHRVWKMAPGPNRKTDRARTFTGIADAMAEQWGVSPAITGGEYAQKG
jgi:hypothetical protein